MVMVDAYGHGVHFRWHELQGVESESGCFKTNIHGGGFPTTYCREGGSEMREGREMEGHHVWTPYLETRIFFYLAAF